MTVLVVPGYDLLSALAARAVAELARRRKDLVVALPTGRTPLGLYRRLAAARTEGAVDLRAARVFGLDEYLGLSPDHPAAAARTFRELIVPSLGLDPRRVRPVDGLAADPAAEAARVEEAIRAAGGLDLVVLGIGRNGHVGLNEPGSARDSRTRVVSVAPESRAALAGASGARAPAVPQRGITLGVATILEARRVLLLASGREKAEILRRAVEEPPTPAVPASFLQEHPAALVVADAAAAAGLRGQYPRIDSLDAAGAAGWPGAWLAGDGGATTPAELSPAGWTVVHHAVDPVAAAVVRGLLEAHGIPAVLESDAAPSVHPFGVGPLASVRVRVRARDIGAARALLRGIEPPGLPNGR